MISEKKSVRIDSNTLILVNKDIPDSIAKANYLSKRQHLLMRTESPRWKKNPEVKKVEPALEEIQELVNTSQENVDDEDTYTKAIIFLFNKLNYYENIIVFLRSGT
jgi:hypothetical protein